MAPPEALGEAEGMTLLNCGATTTSTVLIGSGVFLLMSALVATMMARLLLSQRSLVLHG